ncbi:aldose epimerase family protein [Streptococcus pseudoporcinus]|uniref:Aldose 1-epimerase n=1 Tax=Streptococcus pseudoporcinus LQ 940-04 TaxID=875093 RepID=G5K8N9_9STRE|nr:aldose epimerase family protein [Streptococcus pseudoporcinus]EFR43896.1 aldose 1-epimerase [Streptococcus pseudoporcinus SPIN 20026]EHI65721.1 aldose 1-epimerase [Streptococcus pseudoporcinus LQ 940-04]VEF94336.1 aldose 1-epimerase [Streptococcus pseudoporcinus]
MELKTSLIEIVDEMEVFQIQLINENGIRAHFLTLGATWQAYLVPQTDGSYKNIVLGHKKPSDYLANGICAGQSIGRVAGRISSGRIVLTDGLYQLPQNSYTNCIHGGPQGFHKQNWSYHTNVCDSYAEVIFSYQARAERDGFPGDMRVTATYRLAKDNSLSVSYVVDQVTQETLFNPTCHVYFNLSSQETIENHSLFIASQQMLETNNERIPSGQILPIKDSPYDFSIPTRLDIPLKQTTGLDDAFVVKDDITQPIAILTDLESQDQVSLFSDRNGLVAYSFNYPEEGVSFERSWQRKNVKHEGLALEAQTLPDAINHKHLGDIRLSKGQKKAYSIRYQFHFPSMKSKF